MAKNGNSANQTLAGDFQVIIFFVLYGFLRGSDAASHGKRPLASNVLIRAADALETAPPGVLPPIRTRQDVPRMVEALRAEIERANTGRPTKFLQPITAKQRERGEGWALLLLGG